jgi:hypothetical protein
MNNAPSKQRGVIAAIWLYAIAAIAILAMFTAAISAWHSYTDGLVKKGHDAGVAEEKALYLARDNKQLRDVEAAKKVVEARVEALEAQLAVLQATALRKYNQGVKDEQAKTNAAVAAAVAGTLVLRDPGKSGASTPCNSVDAKGQSTCGTGGSDGKTGAVLSTEAEVFLLQLTGEADEVVKQLTLAQDEIDILQKTIKDLQSP